MSRANGVAASAGGDSETAKLQVLKQALYDRCKDVAAENDMFSQDELLRLDVIPNRDAALLMKVIQLLSNDKLFITMRESSGNVLWKWRDAQEADKYEGLQSVRCTNSTNITPIGTSNVRPTNKSWYTR